jgi:hypothetical protein
MEQGADHLLRLQVNSAEVEAVLNWQPTVIPSTVIGRAITGNEEVVAFVRA